jgi:hypothetical protein
VSGLLQRLATRAAGRATTVRSDAALPFAAAFSADPAADGGWWPHAADAAADVSLVRRPAPPRAAAGESDAAVAPPRPAAPGRWPAGDDTAAPARAGAATQTPRTASVDRPAGDARPPPDRSVATADITAPSDPAAPRGAPTRASGIAPPAPSPSRLETEAVLPRSAGPSVVAPPWPVPEVELRPRLAVSDGAAAILGPAPPRLMPLTPPPAAPPPTAGPAGAFARPAAPDEVHVHIGRIEVTAVHDAPPPAPRQGPAAGPSLASYLAARSAR